MKGRKKKKEIELSGESERQVDGGKNELGFKGESGRQIEGGKS